jgi:hypothetical protein
MCLLNKLCVLGFMVLYHYRFGPLGSWKVTVSGGWTYDPSEQGFSALVTFDTFSIKPVAFLGLETQVGQARSGERQGMRH